MSDATDPTPVLDGEVAAEYYEQDRHPTCANFGELSRLYLEPRILEFAAPGAKILEVGAGRSTVATVLARAQRDLRGLVLLDRSEAMLRHSETWRSQGARLVCADASATGLPAASIDLVVASLADPYNTLAFWREMKRILVGGGVCLFTTPSHEWSSRFRTGAEQEGAEFLLSSGRTVMMPSYVLTEASQSALLGKAGLVLREARAYYSSDLEGVVISSKLRVAESLPVLRGFIASA